MPTIKSSETQFCKSFLASKILSKPIKFVIVVYEFSFRSVLQFMEIKRSSYDQITSVLRIELKWISAPRGYRESSFNDKLMVPVSHFTPLRMS